MDAKICARKNFPIYVPALAECDRWCIDVHLHKLAAWKMFHIMIVRDWTVSKLLINSCLVLFSMSFSFVYVVMLFGLVSSLCSSFVYR